MRHNRRKDDRKSNKGKEITTMSSDVIALISKTYKDLNREAEDRSRWQKSLSIVIDLPY